MSGKIFVRERRKIEKGEKRPRFRVLGISGIDLKIYVKHMRNKELAQVSEITGAEIVYLKSGKKAKADKPD